MGDLREFLRRGHAASRPRQIPEFNFREDYPLSRDRSSWLAGRLINIRRISLRALVREWNTGEPRHETRRTPLWKEIGEPCPGWSVSQMNIACLPRQYYATLHRTLLHQRRSSFSQFILLVIILLTQTNNPELNLLKFFFLHILYNLTLIFSRVVTFAF